jgi:hypothetical protein
VGLIRPAQKPPEPPEDLTPDTVARYGWRDEPYQGDDACGRCGGWGTMPNDRTQDGWPTFRTCARCLGTCKEPSPTEGKGR